MHSSLHSNLAFQPGYYQSISADQTQEEKLAPGAVTEPHAVIGSSAARSQATVGGWADAGLFGALPNSEPPTTVEGGTLVPPNAGLTGEWAGGSASSAGTNAGGPVPGAVTASWLGLGTYVTGAMPVPVTGGAGVVHAAAGRNEGGATDAPCAANIPVVPCMVGGATRAVGVMAGEMDDTAAWAMPPADATNASAPGSSSASMGMADARGAATGTMDEPRDALAEVPVTGEGGARVMQQTDARGAVAADANAAVYSTAATSIPSARGRAAVVPDWTGGMDGVVAWEKPVIAPAGEMGGVARTIGIGAPYAVVVREDRMIAEAPLLALAPTAGMRSAVPLRDVVGVVGAVGLTNTPGLVRPAIAAAPVAAVEVPLTAAAGMGQVTARGLAAGITAVAVASSAAAMGAAARPAPPGRAAACHALVGGRFRATAVLIAPDMLPYDGKTISPKHGCRRCLQVTLNKGALQRWFPQLEPGSSLRVQVKIPGQLSGRIREEQGVQVGGTGEEEAAAARGCGLGQRAVGGAEVAAAAATTAATMAAPATTGVPCSAAEGKNQAAEGTSAVVSAQPIAVVADQTADQRGSAATAASANQQQRMHVAFEIDVVVSIPSRGSAILGGFGSKLHPYLQWKVCYVQKV